MTEQRLGIIMYGVTGRMGANQHLARSVMAIRKQGGVRLANGERVMPDPILVGRSEEKVAALARQHGLARWSTDLDACLADPEDPVYFDAGPTNRHAETLAKAIRAGKHIFTEKPSTDTLETALDVHRQAREAGIKHGVVQNKLWLPGLRKLKALVDIGFFGRILTVRGEFGYWVFEGEHVPAQRPSWNYRAEDGGDIILDMVCHWRYVLDNLFGGVQSVSCLGATHIPKRWDEEGRPYEATATDACYAMFELEGGIVVNFNTSFCTRVRRDDLLTFHVDGTEGSAVAGLTDVVIQGREATPRCVWNPDIEQPVRFYETWQRVPDQLPAYDNAFKLQWEAFIRHVAEDAPFKWDLLEGAKGVQLAELARKSWQRRTWVDVPPLE